MYSNLEISRIVSMIKVIVVVVVFVLFKSMCMRIALFLDVGLSVIFKRVS